MSLALASPVELVKVTLLLSAVLIGVGGYVEGLLGSGGFDVPDVDVAEVGETFVFGDFGGEGDVVGGWIFEVGGQGGVAVGWVPVHGDVDGNGYAFQGEIVDADVSGDAAAGVGGFEEDTGGDAAEGSDVVGLDVAEAAGGFAADGDGGGAVADDGVADDDVFGWAVYAEAV